MKVLGMIAVGTLVPATFAWLLWPRAADAPTWETTAAQLHERAPAGESGPAGQEELPGETIHTTKPSAPPPEPPDGSGSEKFRPHPDSPDRKRMHEARMQFEKARVAAESGNVAALRKALAAAEKIPGLEGFEDWFDGYAAIAACLEEGPERSAPLVRRFLERHPGSTLKRRVRRYCD